MLNSLSENGIIELASGPLETEFGEYNIRVLTDGAEQCIVAVRGDVQNQERVLCRLHSECICSHVFFSRECDCSNQMRKAMATIAAAELGILIFLTHEGRSNGAAAHIATQQLKRVGVSQDEAYQRIGFPIDNRNYRIAAKAIRHLEIRSISLISASARKQQALAAYGVKIESISARLAEITLLGPEATNLSSSGHYVPIASSRKEAKVLIVGDLAVDYTLQISNEQNQILDLPCPRVGGTALNAARAFREGSSLFPIVFGRIGDDRKETYCCVRSNDCI
jgi:GTP cyclohydrolase II